MLLFLAERLKKHPRRQSFEIDGYSCNSNGNSCGSPRSNDEQDNPSHYHQAQDRAPEKMRLSIVLDDAEISDIFDNIGLIASLSYLLQVIK